MLDYATSARPSPPILSSPFVLSLVFFPRPFPHRPFFTVLSRFLVIFAWRAFLRHGRRPIQFQINCRIQRGGQGSAKSERGVERHRKGGGGGVARVIRVSLRTRYWSQSLVPIDKSRWLAAVLLLLQVNGLRFEPRGGCYVYREQFQTDT